MKTRYLLPLLGAGLVFTACDETTTAASSESSTIVCDKLYAEGAIKSTVKNAVQYEYTCKEGRWELTDSTKIKTPVVEEEDEDEEEDLVLCDKLYASGAKKLELDLDEQSIYEFTCSKRGNWKSTDTIEIIPIIKNILDTVTLTDTITNTVKDTVKVDVIKKDTVVVRDTVKVPTSSGSTATETQLLCDDLYAATAIKSEFDGSILRQYSCSNDGTWKLVSSVEIGTKPVDPLPTSSASEEPENTSSSSESVEPEKISSSSVNEPQDDKSSSSESDEPLTLMPAIGNCPSESSEGLYWCGPNLEHSVTSPLANKTETAGYFITYSDIDEGGESKIVWPVALGNEYYDQALDPVIDLCNGLCGTMKLSGSEYPLAGIVFNVVGEGTDDIEAADASKMSGLCVSYSSDAPLMVEMGGTVAMESALGYDLPYIELPKTMDPTTVCHSWTEFKQSGWSGKSITGAEMSKHLASVKIRNSYSSKSGDEIHFNISAIYSYSVVDTYGENYKENDYKYSCLDESGPLSWCPLYNYEVLTGHDVDGSSGYWYSLDDAVDGGSSSIVWPVALGNEYYDAAMDPVLDYCGGLCGTAILSSGKIPYPYVGVGFNIVNEDREPADVSDYNGICVTYESELAFTITFVPSEEDERALNYDVPLVRVPKSDFVTTKCFTLDNFKQEGWGNGAEATGLEIAKKAVALRIQFQGSSADYDVEKYFNIKAISSINK